MNSIHTRSDVPEDKGTVSFSIRLTEKQRELLSKAAEAKGWTITNLLKNAAIEKAAFILNTAGPSRIDFRGVAQKIVTQVFGTRTARVPDTNGQPIWAQPFESFDDEDNLERYVYPVEISPWEASPEFVNEMRDAARFGGTEFLNLLIDAAEPVAARGERKLPDPIDPSEL
jgi:hypothetical protein